MVSFIGYPRSGKTTLIISLFAEIFAQRILRGVNIIPRGEETIKRVNEDIARLESSRELGPTTDQDLFSYRVEMLTGRNIFSRRYKIELGDFPGEASENLASEEPEWLHPTKYFQWALNADAFIFVIDLEYLSDFESDNAVKYKLAITSSFRAAWQKIKDHHYDGVRRLQDNPIVVVFTKADLLSYSEDSYSEKNMNNSPHLPRNYNKPIIIDSKEQKIMEKENQIKKYFRDVIEYFKSETNKFNIVFSSVFAKEKNDGIRFGMEALARSVLPK
uniref:50S ribosome-binding GTPase n=1 Tax=Candidatus Kentrum sp. TUN TaxID=2126343 RepID=A0A450ZQN9_9GAMM|nr:MAG: 50S ribosome-binding GTPase [Candidatus Kentron sp. TUN]VFK56320.1 MAG: 50S ribosome-binding GTPase [Candidatus Kentron sp. TUN]VFK62236.1 MAG: 50S ribosome-binding GTPase [Candidatus Kentron sp. TUN]